MINKIIKKSKDILINPIRKCYGDLTYTSELKVQSHYDNFPTYRVMDE
jgi:hypothetical protein